MHFERLCYAEDDFDHFWRPYTEEDPQCAIPSLKLICTVAYDFSNRVRVVLV